MQIAKAFFVAIVSLSLLGSLSGCSAILVGAAVGAVGGYVVSPDTVEGGVGKTTEEVWQAAYEVAEIMGRITEEYETEGKIIARINDAVVTIKLFAMKADTTKITVKARRTMVPKIHLAQDVYTKITRQLEK